ncbi:MAG: 50S ribosomal protein L3 [Clostridia bacterium]
MNKAIIGKKLGMTQVFTADGTMVPVTVVEAGPCVVSQVKSIERDGYKAVQLAFGSVKEKKLTKPEAGKFKATGLETMKVLREFMLEGDYKVGDKITCETFKENDFVDVVGTTRGHGFSGNIKRWGFHRLKETHGVGPVHREVGAMSANSSPSRVMKGRKLPGQYGVEQVTILNLTVVKVDAARNVLLIKGAIPGPKGSLVTVRNAVKK